MERMMPKTLREGLYLMLGVVIGGLSVGIILYPFVGKG
jgi:hypothetical protein